MADKEFLYSPAITATTSGIFGIGSNLAWDSYVRDNYNKLNFALQRQANALLARSEVTAAEARALLEQRNLILLAARRSRSPEPVRTAILGDPEVIGGPADP